MENVFGRNFLDDKKNALFWFLVVNLAERMNTKVINVSI